MQSSGHVQTFPQVPYAQQQGPVYPTQQQMPYLPQPSYPAQQQPPHPPQQQIPYIQAPQQVSYHYPPQVSCLPQMCHPVQQQPQLPSTEIQHPQPEQLTPVGHGIKNTEEVEAEQKRRSKQSVQFRDYLCEMASKYELHSLRDKSVLKRVFNEVSQKYPEVEASDYLMKKKMKRILTNHFHYGTRKEKNVCPYPTSPAKASRQLNFQKEPKKSEQKYLMFDGIKIALGIIREYPVLKVIAEEDQRNFAVVTLIRKAKKSHQLLGITPHDLKKRKWADLTRGAAIVWPIKELAEAPEHPVLPEIIPRMHRAPSVQNEECGVEENPNISEQETLIADINMNQLPEEASEHPILIQETQESECTDINMNQLPEEASEDPILIQETQESECTDINMNQLPEEASEHPILIQETQESECTDLDYTERDRLMDCYIDLFGKTDTGGAIVDERIDNREPDMSNTCTEIGGEIIQERLEDQEPDMPKMEASKRSKKRSAMQKRKISNKEPPADINDGKEPKFVRDQWVKVEFDSFYGRKKRIVHYIGQVLEVDSRKKTLYVSFLKDVTENLKTYRQEKDESDVDFSQVVRVLQAPTMDRYGRLLFQ